MGIMNDLQCGYLIGRNSGMPLGGVSCHAYFEFECGKIDVSKLSSAWEKLFHIHKELRSRYCDGSVIECDGLPPNSKVEYYNISDSSKEEQDKFVARFREKRSHRMLDVENGQCTAIALIQLGEEKNILVFDWDLIAGDVRSFLNILEQLACLYENEKSEFNIVDSENLLLKRKEIAKTCRGLAKSIIEEDAEHYPVLVTLPMINLPDKLSGCTYLAEDRWIEQKLWKRFQKKAKEYQIPTEILLMYAFGSAFLDITKDNGILINFPSFQRSESEAENVGDFTDIKLVPIYNEVAESTSERINRLKKYYDRLSSFSGYPVTKIRKKLLKMHPDSTSIAPIVFSPMLDVPLVSDRFKKNFGKLAKMLSQTPQVWLDVQSFVLDGMLYISNVYPQEMFSQRLVKKIADGYEENIKKLIG